MTESTAPARRWVMTWPEQSTPMTVIKLASLPIRRACTRATGSIDGIFYRTNGGTVRVNTADNTAEHIAPMRPPCQDGVVISDGLLFWGPWMCGCQLSLYGHISLGPAGALPAAAPVPEPQLQLGDGDPAQVQPLPCDPGDWSAYQHDSWRSDFTRSDVPTSVKLLWQQEVVRNDLPTAPIVAGGTIFVADRSGVVRAMSSDGRNALERAARAAPSTIHPRSPTAGCSRDPPTDASMPWRPPPDDCCGPTASPPQRAGSPSTAA